jgi:hypothetical protein
LPFCTQRITDGFDGGLYTRILVVEFIAGITGSAIFGELIVFLALRVQKDAHTKCIKS